MQNQHLQQIITAYALMPDTAIVGEHKEGLSNNYALQSGGARLFLKVYRHTDEAKVREIHKVKAYFAEGGIPIVLPRKNVSGETLTILDDTFYALFPYVEGRHPGKGNITLDELAAMGEMLADMHLQSVKRPFVIDDFFKGWDVETFAAKAEAILQVIAGKAERTELDNQMEELVLLKRSLVEANTKRFEDFNLPNDTLTHGDYHDFNLFFNDGPHVTWVFDLEKAEMAPRVIELLRSMEYVIMNGDFSQENIEKAKHYVRAYHQKYPISKEEVAAGVEVRYIKDFHSLWVEGEYNLKSNDRFNRFFESSYLGLQWLTENRAHLKEELLSVLG
ncbi:MAG TPA: phosphotransferase [Verrucomicrobiae bacterium]|nr:phosphotransferase [Verrucomicrobiae bacterium]